VRVIGIRLRLRYWHPERWYFSPVRVTYTVMAAAGAGASGSAVCTVAGASCGNCSDDADLGSTGAKAASLGRDSVGPGGDDVDGEGALHEVSIATQSASTHMAVIAVDLRLAICPPRPKRDPLVRILQ
jgi:hypothetical protein